MNFFSDERAAEMRELFFESATELLQTLNEDGLELEKHPEDAEILRQVRRIVHTLKGDSAACGFQELSELAHMLEDALTPEVARFAKASLANVVLMAADAFTSMISAYRGNLQAPAGDELMAQIEALTHKPAAGVPYKLQARFAWSEYEELMVEAARKRGEQVFNIAFSIDPECPMRAAAVQVIRNVLLECGQLLAIVPDESTAGQEVDVVEALIATARTRGWLEKKCRIPSVVGELLLEEAASKEGAEQVPDIVEHVTTSVHQEEAEPAVNAEETAEQEILPSTITVSEQPATSFSQLENLLRVDADRIDAVLNLVGELIIAKSMMHQTIAEFDKRFPRDPLKMRFSDAMAFQARVLNDLQKSVMKIRMVPVEHLFRRFPRVVRDVARSCGKEVNLVITGQDTDLDKSILDALAEPLAHLVRNSVDHGIESPQERVQAGKAVQGMVRLAAYHQGNQIVIEVADDGRGIDRDRLVAKAIEQNILTQADAGEMTEQDALDLIFHPGLSTAEHVTSISGRGVGMDVVKTVLDRLKGTISVATEEAKGTTFYLRVPLTLAIIKALLFRVGERVYAVPLAAVVEITRASQTEVHRVENHDVIRLREEILTLVHLQPPARQTGAAKKMFVVVVSLGDRKFGLVVDRMVGEEELVIKALDDHLVATDLVSGASILGDGTVVLILNIAAVISRAGRMQMTMGATA
ncbi:MAG TPA: chemotaxis protein CheA [Candidatus Angelobacter sp.]|nr:chemotaxis protein CheA [Candidatus Angelobacter sp.]